MSRPLWGLYRKPGGGYEVAFVHFHEGEPLRCFWEREDAVRAREAQEEADKKAEAARQAKQGDLFS